jgi:hypothetical protein
MLQPSHINLVYLTATLNHNFRKLRLYLNSSSFCWVRAFVNPSATWSLVEMYRTSNLLCSTLSRTKWKSTSTCFVRAWKTGLDDKYFAPILSHHNQGALGHGILNSSIRIWIHITSAVAFAIALYSASVLDLETVACFLALQDIKLEPG